MQELRATGVEALRPGSSPEGLVSPPGELESATRKSESKPLRSESAPVESSSHESHESVFNASTRSPRRFGDVVVDVAARTVEKDGAEVPLTPKEFDLLLALMDREGAVGSRVELMREVWGHKAAVMSRTVDTHIFELRRKLEKDPSSPLHILTVHKRGYRFRGAAPVP